MHFKDEECVEAGTELLAAAGTCSDCGEMQQELISVSKLSDPLVNHPLHRSARSGAHLSIVVRLSMATAISIGFSRFAYALLLPPMRDAFGWSYAEAGALNTANATGYIFGAALVPLAVERWGAARTYRIGLLANVAERRGHAGAADVLRPQLKRHVPSGILMAIRVRFHAVTRLDVRRDSSRASSNTPHRSAPPLRPPTRSCCGRSSTSRIRSSAQCVADCIKLRSQIVRQSSLKRFVSNGRLYGGDAGQPLERLVCIGPSRKSEAQLVGVYF